MNPIPVRLQVGNEIYQYGIDISQFSGGENIDQFIKEELIRHFDILSPYHHIVLFNNGAILNNETNVQEIKSIFGFVDPINIVPINQRGTDYINTSKRIYTEHIDESLYICIKKDSLNKSFSKLSYNDFESAVIIRKDDSTNNTRVISMPIPRDTNNMFIFLEQFNYLYSIPFTYQNNDIINSIRNEMKLDIEPNDFKARLDLEHSQPKILIKFKTKKCKINFTNINCEVILDIPKFTSLSHIAKLVTDNYQNKLHSNEKITIQPSEENPRFNRNNFFEILSDEKFIIESNLRNDKDMLEKIFKINESKSRYQVYYNGLKAESKRIPRKIKTVKDLVDEVTSKAEYKNLNLHVSVKLNDKPVQDNQDINHDNQSYDIIINGREEKTKEKIPKKEQPKEEESKEQPKEEPKEKPKPKKNEQPSSLIPSSFKLPLETYFEERSRIIKQMRELNYDENFSMLILSLAYKTEENKTPICLRRRAKNYAKEDSLLMRDIENVLTNSIKEYSPMGHVDEEVLKQAREAAFNKNDIEEGIKLIRRKLQAPLREILNVVQDKDRLLRDILNRSGYGHNLIKDYPPEEIRNAFT